MREDVSQLKNAELLSTPKSCSVCRCVRTYKLPQVMRKYVLVSLFERRVGRRAAGRRGGVRRAPAAAALGCASRRLPAAAASHAHH